MAGYTYTTLKQAIQDFTDNTETVFVSQIDNFIQNAEERILKEANLQEFRKNATTLTTSGGQYLAKPIDWLFTYSFSLVDGNNDKVFLLHKDVNFLQDYWPTATDTGMPKYYADYDSTNFLFAPTPAAAYTAELHYFYRPTSIVSAGTSWLGTNAGPALLYASLVEAYTFMKGEQDMLQMYNNRYLEALDRLKNLGEGQSTNDQLRRGQIRRVPN
jgi:hypothetical protein